MFLTMEPLELELTEGLRSTWPHLFVVGKSGQFEQN